MPLETNVATMQDFTFWVLYDFKDRVFDIMDAQESYPHPKKDILYDEPTRNGVFYDSFPLENSGAINNLREAFKVARLKEHHWSKNYGDKFFHFVKTLDGRTYFVPKNDSNGLDVRKALNLNDTENPPRIETIPLIKDERFCVSVLKRYEEIKAREDKKKRPMLIFSLTKSGFGETI